MVQIFKQLYQLRLSSTIFLSTRLQYKTAVLTLQLENSMILYSTNDLDFQTAVASGTIFFSTRLQYNNTVLTSQLVHVFAGAHCGE